MRPISSGVREKPNGSRFSSMCSGRVNLGDDDDADLDGPAQRHLGRRDVVLGRDLGQGGVTQSATLERAVALHGHAALGVCGQQRRVVPGPAPRDLFDGGPSPSPRSARPSGPRCSCSRRPCGSGPHPGREEIPPQLHRGPAAPRRLVHQLQVHVVGAECAQALGDSGPGASGVARRQFGGDDNAPGAPGCLPGLRPPPRRCLRSGGFFPGRSSDEGGIEFLELRDTAAPAARSSPPAPPAEPSARRSRPSARRSPPAAVRRPPAARQPHRAHRAYRAHRYYIRVGPP
jgi:hypothetical protein